MPMSLDNISNLKTDRGYIGKSGDEGFKVFGDSKHFGGLGKAISRPHGEDNKNAVKDRFFAAIKKEFGAEYAQLARGEFDQKGTSLISVKDAKAIIAKGALLKMTSDANMAAIRGNATAIAQNHSLSDLKANVPNKMMAVLGEALTEMGLQTYLTEVNTNKDVNETGLTLLGSDLFTKKEATALDGKIRQALIDAHDGKSPHLTDKQIKDTIKDVIKSDPTLKAKLEVLEQLDESSLDGKERDYAIDSLVRNKYKSLQDYQVRSGQTKAPNRANVSLSGKQNEVSYKNDKLGQVLKGANKDQETYNPKAFFDGIQTRAKTGGASVKQFAVNKATLMHFAEQVKDSNPDVSKTLAQRSLAYLAKFAPITDNTSKHDASPLVREGFDTYTRAGVNAMVDKLKGMSSTALGVSQNNLTPVTDGRVMDVIKRDMQQQGSAKVLEWNENTLDSIVSGVIGGKEPVFVDVSEFMAATLFRHAHDPAELKEAREVADGFLSDVLEAHVEDYVDRMNQLATTDPKLDKEAVLKDMRKLVTLGSIVRVGDQDLLYTTQPGTRDSKGDIKMPDGMASKHPTITKENSKENISMSDFFRNMVNHNGFTVGPNQLVENVVNGFTAEGDPISGITNAFERLQVQNWPVSFDGVDASQLKKFDNIDEFKDTQIFKDFASLATEDPAFEVDGPCVSNLTAVTTKMLEGFETIDVMGKFAEKGLEDLLTYELNHIQAGLQVALEAAKNGNMAGFLNAMSLVQADIATIVAIAEPYGLEDFNTEMQKVAGFTDVPELGGIKPEFQLTNSGMRGLSRVLSGLEAQVGERRAPIKVGVMQNSYYESSIAMGESKRHETVTVGDGNTKSAIDKLAQDVSETGEKLDLFVAEFHHNIGVGVDEYTALDVTGQVKEMLTRGLVSDKFTVAIDNTISDPDGDDIKNFLSDPVISQAIKDGKLNVVFYRSAQKFDMAGFDNFNGGIVSTVNNGSFGEFMDGMNTTGEEGDNISKFNLQGLTYFQAMAREELSEYRGHIVANTRKMLSPHGENNKAGFNPESKLAPETLGQRFIQVTPNSDPGAVFVDLRSAYLDPEKEDSTDFYSNMHQFMLRYASQPGKDMALQGRPSFGFAHSNISTIGGDKFRFNPGLENPEKLAEYRDIFENLNDVFGKIDSAYNGGPKSGAVVHKLMENFASNASVFDAMTKFAQGETLSTGDSIEVAKAFMAAGGDRIALEILDGLSKSGNLNSSELKEVNPLLTEAKQKSDAELSTSANKLYQAGNNLVAQLLNRNASPLDQGRAAVGTLVDQIEGQGIVDTGPVVDNIAVSLDLLTLDSLQGMETALKQIQTSFGGEESVRKDVVDGLLEKVQEQIQTKGPARPKPPSVDQRMRNQVQTLVIQKEGQNIEHGLGKLMTEIQSGMGGTKGVLSEGALKETNFGMIASKLHPALDTIRDNVSNKLSPETERAFLNFVKQEGDNIPGLNPGVSPSEISSLLAQGFVRNMQMTVREMIDRAMVPEGDSEKEGRLNDKIGNLANELQEKTLSGVQNMRSMAAVLTNETFLATLTEPDKTSLTTLGQQFQAIVDETTKPNGLVDFVMSFATEAQENPQAFVAEIRRING